jgi:hypothetical protein
MEAAEPVHRERRIVRNLVVSTEPAEPAPFPDMAGIPDECHRQQQARIMLTSAGDQLWAGEWRCATPCKWCKSIRTDVVSTLPTLRPSPEQESIVQLPCSALAASAINLCIDPSPL